MHHDPDWTDSSAQFDGLLEERGPIEISVVGTIPAWTAGNLYRTGPGQCKVEGTPKGTHYVSHWFDGLAHTHRFEIVPVDGENGGVRVFYSSRRQSEARMRMMQEQGAAKLFSFGQRSDPCIGLLGKLMSTFKATALARSPRMGVTDNINVAIFANVPGVEAHMKKLPGAEAAKLEPAVVGHRATPPAAVWVTTDTDTMRRIDPSTLEPIGLAKQDSLHPDLKGPMSSAHAQRDPVTGDFYNFNLELGPNPTYRVFRLSQATGKTDILATIRCDRKTCWSSTNGIHPAYIHSFFLTKKYVVLRIPCTHILMNGIKIIWNRNVMEGLETFREENTTRWIVIDRSMPPQPGGDAVVAHFESPAGFFFHSVNAFDDDEDGSIICDVVDYPTSDILDAFFYDVLLNRNGAAVEFYKDSPVRVANIASSLSRFRLKLPPKETEKAAGPTPAPPLLQAERLWSIATPHAGELPTINPAYATKPHRYVYGISTHGRSTLADSLCKTDTVTRSALLWIAPQGHTPGEAIFIARARDGAEDDGVLLSVVLDGTASRSYLLCLDARTMQEMGRAVVGFAVGLGFHGMHTGI